MANPFVSEPTPTAEVILHTSLGDITLELFCKEAPKACRNFIQLSLEGYYDGCQFFRVVPNFIAQTGDPTNSGRGGESIYEDNTFEDEISQRLKFVRRGMVAMANEGEKDTNTSQFFFTLDRTDALQGKHTIFARVASDRTVFNLMKINTIESVEGTERPVYPPVIKSVEVVTQYFEDIVPRMTAAERKEQDRARKEARARAKESKGPKRKGAKNAGLLSFGGEEEAQEDPSMANVRFKSAHDIEDKAGRLSKQVIDDRGISAELPAAFLDMPPAKRKAVEPTAAVEAKTAKRPKAVVELTDDEKRKAEIAAMQDSLRSLRRRGSDASDDDRSKAKAKAKADGPSAIALERAKYTKAKDAKSKKKDTSLDDLLKGFRTKVRSAAAVAPAIRDVTEAYEGEVLEDDDEGLDAEAGMAFLGHQLKFRKDVTADIHKIDEYSVHDPLLKREGFTLEDAKAEDERRRRNGLIPGSKSRDRDRGDRGRDERRR